MLLVVAVMMMVAGCSGDCALEEEVDWGSYGYFQTCRAHHIKQALQVMKPSYIYIPLNIIEIDKSLTWTCFSLSE